MEDDPDPVLEHAFENFAVYAATRIIHIRVYDTAMVKKKKDTPVLVGVAGTSSRESPGLTMDIDSAMLPLHHYKMDGSDLDVELFECRVVGKKKERKEVFNNSKSAGIVKLRLTYIPSLASLVPMTSVAICNTWYYEMTVLFMCGLSMVSLAMRSPAVPPSPAFFAVMRVMELFVTLHMLVELLMEVMSRVVVRQFNPKEMWFLMASWILFCNAFCLFVPPGTNYFDPRIERLISVSRVLRVTRPMRTLRLIKHMDMIISTLLDSVTLFLTVCLLVIFLLCVFALVGSSSFAGALQYECIDNSQNCTQAQHNISEKMDLSCPFECPSTLHCAASDETRGCAPLEEPRVVGNDEHGFYQYDNIWYGIITVFVQTTGDGGMHALPVALHEAGATTTGRAWVMSFFVSIMLNLVALNLFLAVCCSAYSDVAIEQEQLEASMEKVKAEIKADLIANETPEEKQLRGAYPGAC